MRRANSGYVPRIVQLDAVDLDQEVVRILKDQLVNVFKYSGSSFLATWEHELELLLKIFIWKFSVIRSNATFGQQLLGLKYGNNYSNKKAWLFAFIAFGTKYLQSRSIEISNLTSSRRTKDLIHKTSKYLDVGIQVLNLINFMTFLRKGVYPTLAYRILGLTIVPVDPGKSRKIGYSYMTRELLWHGFVELLVFTLPLINFHYMKRRICSLFFTKKPVSSVDAKLDKNSLCSVCGEPPVLPQQIGCAHVYCYYCIKAQLLADPQYECQVCGFLPQGTVQPVKM